MRRRPAEVAVRYVRSQAFADVGVATRARAILMADECTVLARLRPPAAQLDYLAAHVLARGMLAEVSGSEPAGIELRCPPGGSPEWAAPADALPRAFSISHADGIALCAVASGCRVGADVESLRNFGPDPLDVAEVVCSTAEKERLGALPATARAEYLLHLWTVKEAVAKAMGLGFRLPFDRITVQPTGDGAALHFAEPMAGASSHTAAHELPACDDPSGWRIAVWRVTHHLAAVAVCLPAEGEVVFRFAEWEAGGIQGANPGAGARPTRDGESTRERRDPA